MNDDSKPVVSVIVPAHNAETTIQASIDSALQQTLGNFELLIIDDGSKDATAEISANIADSRVSCFSFVNAGPSAARNRGIERASGEFIAFLDADDLWLPGKLAAQVDMLRKNPGAALVYCWSDSIDEAGNFLKKGHYVRPKRPVYEQLITWNIVDNGSTPMVRRDALMETGVFDEELRLAEDWDLWLRLAFRYPIVCVPEVQVLYRVRQSSASSNVQPQAEGSVEVLQRALNRLPETRARRRLKRTAQTNLYLYLAMRLVETSTGRRTGLEAAGYWWQAVCTTPNLFTQLQRFVLTGGAILAILVLPAHHFRRLRRSWSRLRAMKTGRKSIG